MGLFLLLVVLEPRDSNVVVYMQVIAIIILSLKFIDSFKAATFSFTWFFPPSCFSLFSSGRSFSCHSHFVTPASRKK